MVRANVSRSRIRLAFPNARGVTNLLRGVNQALDDSEWNPTDRSNGYT